MPYPEDYKPKNSVVGDLSTYMTHRPNKLPPRNVEPSHLTQPTSFTQQKVTYEKTPLFFPHHYETLFLAGYIVLLPYFAGLAFLFFYVFHGSMKLFSYHHNSFIWTWAIGYEMLASLTLLMLLKSALSFQKPTP
jgi:hypothetical protein